MNPDIPFARPLPILSSIGFSVSFLGLAMIAVSGHRRASHLRRLCGTFFGTFFAVVLAGSSAQAQFVCRSDVTGDADGAFATTASSLACGTNAQATTGMTAVGNG